MSGDIGNNLSVVLVLAIALAGYVVYRLTGGSFPDRRGEDERQNYYEQPVHLDSDEASR